MPINDYDNDVAQAVIHSSWCRRFNCHLHDTYYELIPSTGCSSCHVVCPVCFGALHAERGCNPTFACPAEGCENKIIGHCCFSPSVEKNRDGTLINNQPPIPGRREFHRKPDENIDAVRVYHNRTLEFQKQHIVLSTSFLSDNQKEFNTVSVEVPLEDHCEDYDEVMQMKLLAISTNGSTRIFGHISGSIRNQTKSCL